ncbi:hypothetical protein Q3G72_018349 [Acer saccharum]|nr:hypothetical protein Q3G72_018349 [Acer saccharum]
MFSSFIGVGLSAVAEVHAILKACQMCECDSCPSGVKIIIESDSIAAVAWVNGVSSVGNVRCVNAAADFLTKQGAASGLVMEAWAC